MGKEVYLEELVQRVFKEISAKMDILGVQEGQDCEDYQEILVKMDSKVLLEIRVSRVRWQAAKME